MDRLPTTILSRETNFSLTAHCFFSVLWYPADPNTTIPICRPSHLSISFNDHSSLLPINGYYVKLWSLGWHFPRSSRFRRPSPILVLLYFAHHVNLCSSKRQVEVEGKLMYLLGPTYWDLQEAESVLSAFISLVQQTVSSVRQHVDTRIMNAIIHVQHNRSALRVVNLILTHQCYDVELPWQTKTTSIVVLSQAMSTNSSFSECTSVQSFLTTMPHVPQQALHPWTSLPLYISLC